MTGFELMLVIGILLLVYPLYIGFVDYVDVSVYIEINTFTSSYFILGVSHEYKDYNSTHRIDQITIGMVFINLNICFMKEIDA